MTSVNFQTAPYPEILAGLVDRLRYRQHLGWRVWLDDNLQRDKPGRHSGESRGLTLVVQRTGHDSYHTESVISVLHYFPVPPATYNEASWTRWLFDRLGDVDTHERMEDFALWPVTSDGEPFAATPEGGAEPELTRPYKPNHGPGEDPYRVTELTTDEARRTSFRGEVSDH